MRDPNLDYCQNCGAEVGVAGLCVACRPVFLIKPHSGIDKTFSILGPLGMEVDYDDVDHEEQDILSRYVVRVLNDHWRDPAYARFREEFERLWRSRA